MAGSNNPADGNVRLWAVRRKEGARRPFSGSATADARPTRGHGAAVRRAYRPSRTGRELDLVVRHFDDQRLHPDEVGTLSAAVPATLVGSGATALSSGESKLYTLLAIAAGIALWLIAGRLISSFLKKKRAENGSAALDSEPVSPE